MKNRARGFTLIEVLVAIAIIGVIATVVTVSLNAARGKGKISAAKSQLAQIYRGLAEMSLDTSQWPGHQPYDSVCVNNPPTSTCPSDNEIWDLNAPSAGLVATDGTYPGWNGPYVKALSLDPWGQPYFLDTDYSVRDVDEKPCAGSTSCHDVAVVGSFGPNGVGRNNYDSDDLILIIAK